MARLGAVLLLGASFAVGVRAGQDQPSADGPTFSVSVDLVKVPLSVFDDRGDLVRDLRREDFRLYEDGRPQSIRSFGIDRNPVSVVLVVDTSGSVDKELRKIRGAARSFVEALAPDDRVSLVTFSDEPVVLADWGSSRRQLRRALGKLESGLRTSLYDAMFLAAAGQLGGVDGRKAIILLTDGINNQSSIDFQGAARSVVQSQATLYVVSKTIMAREAARRERRVVMLTEIYRKLGGDEDYVDQFFRRREEELTELAGNTGGRAFFPSDLDQIRGVYEEVAAELKSKYFLTYISRPGKPANSYHRIVVEYLPPSSKLTYRQGYYYRPDPARRPRYGLGSGSPAPGRGGRR